MKGLIINANSPRGEILKQKSVKVTKNNYKAVAKQFMKKVLPLQVGNRCQGLAGNQIGMSESIFTAKLGNKWITCLNPKIIDKGGKVIQNKEGCLSVSGKSVKVPRNTQISLIFNDVGNFQTQSRVLYGNDAIVVQHETDHLNGKLITDYKDK